MIFFSGKEQAGVKREDALLTLKQNLSAALPLLQEQGNLYNVYYKNSLKGQNRSEYNKKAVFRILIHWYGSGSNTDPGFWWPKIEKNLQLKFFIFFLQKLQLTIVLHKRRPSYRRSLQISKRTSSTSKHEIQFFQLLWVIFALLDTDPDPDQDPLTWLNPDTIRIRIQIHWPDWIRIQYGSGSRSETLKKGINLWYQCWFVSGIVGLLEPINGYSLPNYLMNSYTDALAIIRWRGNHVQQFNPEAESKGKLGVWVPIPELTITSPYAHSRVESNTFTMDKPMPEPTLTLFQSRLYPPVWGFGFGLWAQSVLWIRNDLLRIRP